MIDNLYRRGGESKVVKAIVMSILNSLGRPSDSPTAIAKNDFRFAVFLRD